MLIKTIALFDDSEGNVIDKETYEYFSFFFEELESYNEWREKRLTTIRLKSGVSVAVCIPFKDFEKIVEDTIKEKNKRIISIFVPEYEYKMKEQC